MKEPLKNSTNFDELYTPKYAVEPLLKYLGNNKGITIWCPCDTQDSEVVKILSDAGYKVIASHIDDGTDFLTCTPPEDFDMVITNPPYSIKDKIINRCYSLNKPFALLLPLTALEGTRRHELFKNGIGVVVLDKRVDFNGKGKCWYNTSWFVHSHMMDGRLFFEKIQEE